MGYRFRIKKVKGRYAYLIGYKYEQGTQIEKTLTRLDLNLVDKVQELINKYYTTPPSPPSKTTTSTTTPHEEGRVGGEEREIIAKHEERVEKRQVEEGVGGSSAQALIRTSVSVGSVLSEFRLHRLHLKYVGGKVSILHVRSLGWFRYNEVNKQWVGRFCLGRDRWVTVQVNRDGTAQVYLAADNNPLDVWEFVGFCRGTLLFIFSLLTGGREVGLGEFYVMTYPEFNIDLPGVKIVEGARCLTLQEYYDEVVRIYFKQDMKPEAGTRVEVLGKSWSGRSLSDLVSGLVGLSELSRVLVDFRKDLEVVKGTLDNISKQNYALPEVISNRVGNLLLYMLSKIVSNLEDVVKKLVSEIDSLFKPVREGLEELERLRRENEELRRRLETLSQEDSSIKFKDLPSDLRKFLKQLEDEGYVRLTETRIAYGDRVWAAIFRRKGNIDLWIEEESYNFYDNKDLFKAVLKTIRFYDNKYQGKPGIPYDKFLETLKDYLEKNRKLVV